MPAFSLPVFVEAAARASAILASTGLAAVALRRSSASARHLVWALGLASALVVPALSLALPKLEVPIVRIAAPVTSNPGIIASAPDLPANAASNPVGRRDLCMAPAFGREEQTPSTAATATTAISTTTLLFAIWALGVAIVLGRMLIGLAAVAWMSRRSRVAPDGPWLALARDLAADLGLKDVRVVQGASAAVPRAWGVFRASVLMPAGADAWPVHRLRVVLLHELAHVKRRDCLTHLIAQVVCAAYWFNPLAWIAARRLRTERERACDDLVLAAGTRGSDYADELLDIARAMQAQRFPAVLAGA